MTSPPASPPLALPLRALAPAKINLGLFVGGVREDGRHRLVTVMQSISLADELVRELAPARRGGAAGEGAPAGELAPARGRAEGEGDGDGDEVEVKDEVVCPGVPGENLAARALALFRDATGWDPPTLRLTIDKRIPLAAGLGGGSADAAAALRLAAAASGLGDEGLLLQLAGQLGADVPAQVRPGRWLATGGGEVLEELPDPAHPLGVLVLPAEDRLSTGDVYAQVDRLGVARGAVELEELRGGLRRAFELGMALPADPSLLDNDLQGAALALSPGIEGELLQARDAGAEVALLSGSGPTVLGLFARANGAARAERAVAALAGRRPPALAAISVGADFGEVVGLSVGHN